MNTFLVNSTYTFNTLAPAILGAVIKNAKHVTSCDFDTAMGFENVAVKYEEVYPALPPGSPSSPRSVVFHRFITESGEKILVADSWIDGSSVVSITNINATIDLVNVTNQDLTNVRVALGHLGISFRLTINP